MPDRPLPSGVPSKAFVKASIGLAVGVLILSACGSSAAPSATPSPTVPEPSSIAASVAPSVVASVPAATAVTSSITPDATIAVPEVERLAFDGAMLWVFTGSGASARVDPATNAIGALTTVDATHQDGGFAVNKQGLWLNDFDTSLLYRIDPASLKVVAKIRVGLNPEGLAVDPKNAAIWVANHRGGTVSRIDPTTNTVVATIPVGNTGPSGPHHVGLGLGSVWVGVPNTSSVYRIDPTTNKVQATIAIPAVASPCSGFAFGEKAVWMSSCFDTTMLVRIDPDREQGRRDDPASWVRRRSHHGQWSPVAGRREHEWRAGAAGADRPDDEYDRPHRLTRRRLHGRKPCRCKRLGMGDRWG